MTQAILLNEYDQIVKAVLETLAANPEWKRRYHNYCLDEGAISSIRKMRKAFRVRAPIYSYLTISKAINADVTTATFDLRYQGQSIADLVVSAKTGENNQGYEVALRICQGKAETNLRDFGFSMAENASGKPVWSLKDATKFRAHFKVEPVRTDVGNKKNREHRFESEILTDMRKKSADGKILCNMQPVLLCGERFQMPTPLSASGVKSGRLEYGGPQGGGIDILARAGTGGANTNLCIIEVKDQNESKEPPQAAMKQAIAYTTFIWQLLRADAALGQKWWNMFGFGRDIPEQLTLFAVVAMPAKDSDEKYPGAEIQLNQDDRIVLHYIDIDETTGKPISKTF